MYKRQGQEGRRKVTAVPPLQTNRRIPSRDAPVCSWSGAIHGQVAAVPGCDIGGTALRARPLYKYRMIERTPEWMVNPEKRQQGKWLAILL